ncbi:MAG: dockerin type I domain-containing protein [Candidatus Marinimicrobia bacterium]|nr:dockerin type I domain-containing protein [Candidatus Neomarinimicrobiota bacterium]
MKIFIIILLMQSVFALNYSEDISPIIYDNCTLCHREGEIGAFLPLTNYQEVFENRYWISYAISGNGDGSRHGNPIMPPWPADRSYSTLLDEMYLSEDEIHSYLEWVDEGAMQGDPALEYPMPDYPTGSAIGVPDMVLELEESYFIEGNFQDDYRCFVLETGFTEDKDIAALEFIPGNLEAVHHALIVATPEGTTDALEAEDPEYGYDCFGGFGTFNISDFLGGYAPGVRSREWPNGLAQQIPANSELIVQIHYAPLGSDQTDLSSVNIFFKEEPAQRYVQERVLINFTFQLPPNQLTEVHEVWNVYQDISLIQFLPHSHLLGKSWEIFALTPTSPDTIPLIKIPQWDFDWQFWYSPEYMIHLPQGSEVHAICTYDNTSDNPDNPNNPPQWTYWGEGTEDEMFFVPFRYVDYQPGDENFYLGDLEYILGDVNNDSLLNVLDVVSLVNLILNGGETTPACDVNGDESINVLDVVTLVNMILSG